MERAWVQAHDVGTAHQSIAPGGTPLAAAMSASGASDRTVRDRAFEAVVEHYQTPLLRYAARIVNNADAAQDVVQTAFIRLHKTWRDAFEPSAQLASWLYRVTHNCAVDHVRRESRRQDLHARHAEERDVRHGPVTGPRPRAKDPRETARQALQVLDLREQQLVVLKVYEEKSYREMSEITGLSEGNIGYILHHAMKKMATAIREGNEPS